MKQFLIFIFFSPLVLNAQPVEQKKGTVKIVKAKNERKTNFFVLASAQYFTDFDDANFKNKQLDTLSVQKVLPAPVFPDKSKGYDFTQFMKDNLDFEFPPTDVLMKDTVDIQVFVDGKGNFSYEYKDRLIITPLEFQCMEALKKITKWKPGAIKAKSKNFSNVNTHGLITIIVANYPFEESNKPEIRQE